MGQILKEIYTDISLSSFLGFKGGTCAYFFYDLPRFSVDLDFDFLGKKEEETQYVFEKILILLKKYGKIKDQCIKKFTIFAVLSYGEDDHNIKIEVNLRKQGTNIRHHYEIKEYLGVSLFVAKKEYVFASKLSALTSRKGIAMRDVFDIHYFAKNNWDINAEVIKERTGKTVKEYLSECIFFIEKIKENHILQGLGELIENEKEKTWIRNHLKNDTLFLLKNYISVMKE
jgi:predicted nucleotidyltransferase component of viral defense system